MTTSGHRSRTRPTCVTDDARSRLASAAKLESFRCKATSKRWIGAGALLRSSWALRSCRLSQLVWPFFFIQLDPFKRAALSGKSCVKTDTVMTSEPVVAVEAGLAQPGPTAGRRARVQPAIVANLEVKAIGTAVARRSASATTAAEAPIACKAAAPLTGAAAPIERTAVDECDLSETVHFAGARCSGSRKVKQEELRASPYYRPLRCHNCCSCEH